MLERLLKRLPWVEGRQGSGYHKFKLFESKWLKADSYLLYYPEGAHIPVHRDQVQGHEHHRLNIELVQATEGGFLKTNENGWIGSRDRVHRFRSDEFHEVTRINKGYRLVWSIGWLR